jgi:hypothetical protein
MENNRERKSIKLDFGIRQNKSLSIMPRYADLEAYFKSGRKVLIFDVGLDDKIFAERFNPNPEK